MVNLLRSMFSSPLRWFRNWNICSILFGREIAFAWLLQTEMTMQWQNQQNSDAYNKTQRSADVVAAAAVVRVWPWSGWINCVPVRIILRLFDVPINVAAACSGSASNSNRLAPRILFSECTRINSRILMMIDTIETTNSQSQTTAQSLLQCPKL